MRKLDEIFEFLDGIIPETAKKSIMYCEVEKTAYEIFYYSFYDTGIIKHSSEIVDAGELDASVIEDGFAKIAEVIRDSDQYDSEQRNVVTITIEGSSEKVEVDQFDKSIGLYKIKKEWKSAHI